MVSNDYQGLLMDISQLSMVINGYCYQQVINGYQGLLMVISQLSMVINGYQGLLIVISQLSMVIIGYWLSTSYLASVPGRFFSIITDVEK